MEEPGSRLCLHQQSRRRSRTGLFLSTLLTHNTPVSSPSISLCSQRGKQRILFPLLTGRGNGKAKTVSSSSVSRTEPWQITPITTRLSQALSFPKCWSDTSSSRCPSRIHWSCTRWLKALVCAEVMWEGGQRRE